LGERCGSFPGLFTGRGRRRWEAQGKKNGVKNLNAAQAGHECREESIFLVITRCGFAARDK